MSWKSFVQDHLAFTRKDRIGMLVLSGLVILVLIIPVFVPTIPSSSPPADTAWIAAMKELEVKESDLPREDVDRYAHQPYDRAPERYNESPGLLFYFDPNTLNDEGWKKLGLREKTIRTIRNYLQKGGQFRKPDDLQRIYGLRKELYERIAPYVKIESRFPAPTTNNRPAENYPARKKTEPGLMIDINSADTTAFISLPGIGPKLAARIVNFRDRLGGFYSIDQVAETFGLPDSTFQKIRPRLRLENTLIRMININTATLEELKAHPYIRYALANPIIAYRNEHGPFQRVEEIKKIMVVTEELYNKISGYLTIKN